MQLNITHSLGAGEDTARSQVAAKLTQALALHRAGDSVQAQVLYDEIRQVHPEHFEALHMSGIIALAANEPKRAVELIERAMQTNPQNAAAHTHLGNARLALADYDSAMACYDRAAALDPNHADTYYNRGNALLDSNRYEEAIADFDRAIAVKPDFSLAYTNRGIALAGTGQDGAAVASFDRAIAIGGGSAEAHYNRGIVLQTLQRFDAALDSYSRAIEMNSVYAEAYVNRAMVLLLLGRFDQGWKDFEWRWMKTGSSGILSRPDFRQPLWLGDEPIANKTILLIGEQGSGDVLQFCRYARLVADLGAKVILQVHQPLKNLLANLPGVSQLAPHGEPLPHFDCYCPLMSLPLVFKSDLTTIPAAVRYLKSDPDKVRRWGEKLGARSKPRVGLVWSGGFRPDQPEMWAVNNRRNIPLAELAPLNRSDIEFYSLQKGQPAESELIDLISSRWDGPHLIDHTSLLADFSDTAALIEHLDLVISVDTSTAHLAGALGKPVWMLNRFDTCWRWLLDRTDSPWYPTLRLYRQDHPGDWSAVVQRVGMDLAKVAAGAG
jgi:tetratricopeptide (TPR) repeat protein